MFHEIETPQGKYDNANPHDKSFQAIAMSQMPIAML